MVKLALEANDVTVFPPLPFPELNKLYNSAHTVYVPCETVGGGERAVMEAFAAGVNVEVEQDNPKLLVTCPLFPLLLTHAHARTLHTQIGHFSQTRMHGTSTTQPHCVVPLHMCSLAQEILHTPVRTAVDFADNVTLAIGMALAGGRASTTLAITKVCVCLRVCVRVRVLFIFASVCVCKFVRGYVCVYKHYHQLSCSRFAFLSQECVCCCSVILSGGRDLRRMWPAGSDPPSSRDTFRCGPGGPVVRGGAGCRHLLLCCPAGGAGAARVCHRRRAGGGGGRARSHHSHDMAAGHAAPSRRPAARAQCVCEPAHRLRWRWRSQCIPAAYT